MRITPIMRAAGRQPLIKFLGKRSVAGHNIEAAASPSEPIPHPESPSGSLPDSFMAYRTRAQQHGPLGSSSSKSTRISSSSSSHSAPSSRMLPHGAIGGHSAHELGSTQPPSGQAWDRSELPARFGRLKWTEQEMELLESGGAGERYGWGSA